MSEPDHFSNFQYPLSQDTGLLITWWWNKSGSLGCQFSLTLNCLPHILDRLTCGIQQWEEARKVSSSMSFKIIAGISGIRSNDTDWFHRKGQIEREDILANPLKSKIEGRKRIYRIFSSNLIQDKCRNLWDPIQWHRMIPQKRYDWGKIR